MKTFAIIVLFTLLQTGLKAQIVDTQFGQIQGSVNGSVYEFLGIPFAKPPVDSLRWKAPKNPDSWTGILNTTKFAPVCPQKKFVQGDSIFTFEGEEDCLYLNIWTPEIGNFDYPVMVFIHGGGNQQGGASQISGGTEMYSGLNLAERGNVVVVTIQYRLGPLGFLVHPGLETENAKNISGNYAVLDQILALAWIQNNIELFGGDPRNVMIFGESAGGVNVGNLLTTEHAKGLFHKACIQSAAPSINTYNDSKTKGIAFVDSFVTTGTNIEKISYLRTLPADSIMHYETSPLEGGIVQGNWKPVVDNVIFKDFPAQVFQSGSFNKVPLIIGSNADEMSLSAPQTVLPVMVTILIKNTVPAELQNSALNLYPPGTNTSEARNSYIGILTDAQFTVNARRTAQCISVNQNEPVWRYFFTYKHSIQALANFGSYHGMELFYVFNNWENTLLGSGLLFKPEDEAVQNAMLKYWVNFAKTGNPNGSELENWPQYKGTTDCYMKINSTSDGTNCGLRTSKSDLWDDAFNFVSCSGTVYSEDTQDNNTLIVYPNPSDGIFRFKLSVETAFEVTVFNTANQIVYTSNNSNQINLKNQSAGIYFVEVKTANGIFKGKILKTD